MIKVFVCDICNEVYIGVEKPASCPFCGVSQAYLKTENFDLGYDIVLSEKSKDNVEKALALELSNTAFYKCIAENQENQEIKLMFKGLFKIEREHASIFQKLLKLESTKLPEEKCDKGIEDLIKESSQREQRAVEFYKQAMTEAEEPRLKKIFGAIMLTEKDHLELDQAMLTKIN